MPNGDNIGVKSILVMSPIYMTSQSGALCIYQLHIFLENRICLVRESLPRIYKKCFKGLVGWLLGAFKAQLAKWRKG